MFSLVAAMLIAQPPTSKPNVILILADDLGVNDLACYGRHDHRTPNLDRMAAEGTRFTNAYASCPVCSPTRAALLTGKNPARLHLTTFLPGRPDAPSQRLLHPKIRMELPLEEITIAERLKEAGYTTACIGKWHLGGKGFGPKEQGFDFVQPGKADTEPSETEGGKGEYDLTKKAEEFITANKDRPFYLHLCHNNPHVRLRAKPKLIENNPDTYNPTYAAMIETLDDCVGRILKTVDELKLKDRTIIAFTSDNGGLHVPELGDPPTFNKPYRAGKGFLYEGGLRIPLIVRHPNSEWAGRTDKQLVVSADWTPTVLQWCGLPSVAQLDGVSFASTPMGVLSQPRMLFWHFPHYTNQGSRPGGAVREGNWKFIEHYEDGRVELFDLDADPGETKNLTESHGMRTHELSNLLNSFLRSAAVQSNTPNPNFDSKLHRALYIDVDVSKLKPSPTAAETSQRFADWRQLMNDAVRPARKGAKP
jgi:arylsulfatase A